MKATDLLKQQHKDVKAQYKRVEDTEDPSEQRQLFAELATSLVAHDAIEREIFYPACEKEMGMTDLLGEALVEHGVIEFSLYCADQAKTQDDFNHKCTVLWEMVEHHIEEEEEEFFPEVEKAFDTGRLQLLGEQMLRRFNAALKQDFRAPLHDNLKQVLVGVTKTVPGGSKSKPAPKRSGEPGTAKSKGASSKRNGKLQRHA